MAFGWYATLRGHALFVPIPTCEKRPIMNDLLSSRSFELPRTTDNKGDGAAANFWAPVLKRTGAVVVALAVWSTAAIAGESLDALSTRMRISVMSAGIKHGDFSSLVALPVKGYKDGMAGFMRQFHLSPNPEYSFTDCGDDILVTDTGYKPGCRVSIKLASKNDDGSFRDRGVRLEYGIAPGSKRFQPNNSAYAEHAISGDGLLEAQFN